MLCNTTVFVISEMKHESVEYIKHLETRLFAFTRKEVLELVYQFADVDEIPHNFNQEAKMAIPEWLTRFRRRNSDKSLKNSETTSAA